MFSPRLYLPLFFLLLPALRGNAEAPRLALNDAGYFEARGLSVYVYADHYLEGRQGGLIVVQHDDRVASNGDLTLETAPGQWQPFSEDRGVVIDRDGETISATRGYPNAEARDRFFNPIPYPELALEYTLHVTPEGNGFRLRVDLKEPLPEAWVGRVGFNLELFPGAYFGKRFLCDGAPGLFPRQFNGPREATRFDDPFSELEIVPLGKGEELIVSPEAPETQITFRRLAGGPIELYDGRGMHHNGWFVVRALVGAGATEGAIEWYVEPHTIEGWRRPPVIQVSQVGYHPQQPKRILVEYDPTNPPPAHAVLRRFDGSAEGMVVGEFPLRDEGAYRKYHYASVNLTSLTEPGVYALELGDVRSSSFAIDPQLFSRDLWQPTLDTFLPVQMCHMRVNDRYRVWHGVCHLDDALMAPVNTAHFDGYTQGPSTLTAYAPGDPVPGLNVGGWHDAGDYDLRIESQAGTVRTLAFIWEEFRPERDQTLTDPERRLVELHTPDGIPDILQQIEHGLASILGGYDALGRLYRGIISNDLRQYVHLGDAATMTDNLPQSGTVASSMHPTWSNHEFDDRWVFTEENPRRALEVAAALATVGHALAEDRPQLAERCVTVARELWEKDGLNHPEWPEAADAAAELFLATGKRQYAVFLARTPIQDARFFAAVGWSLVRIVGKVPDADWIQRFRNALGDYRAATGAELAHNPYRVPLIEQTWGSVWRIQEFARQQYYFHHYTAVPEARGDILSAFAFILGVHPGKELTSFVSGVGAHSPLVAYGTNRADWSYIPGGVVSGVGYIKPDFPEFKEWPYFWQQGEYVMGGGATNFIFLALATQELIDETAPETTQE